MPPQHAGCARGPVRPVRQPAEPHGAHQPQVQDDGHHARAEVRAPSAPTPSHNASGPRPGARARICTMAAARGTRATPATCWRCMRPPAAAPPDPPRLHATAPLPPCVTYCPIACPIVLSSCGLQDHAPHVPGPAQADTHTAGVHHQHEPAGRVDVQLRAGGGSAARASAAPHHARAWPGGAGPCLPAGAAAGLPCAGGHLRYYLHVHTYAHMRTHALTCRSQTRGCVTASSRAASRATSSGARPCHVRGTRTRCAPHGGAGRVGRVHACMPLPGAHARARHAPPALAMAPVEARCWAAGARTRVVTQHCCALRR